MDGIIIYGWSVKQWEIAKDWFSRSGGWFAYNPIPRIPSRVSSFEVSCMDYIGLSSRKALAIKREWNRHHRDDPNPKANAIFSWVTADLSERPSA